MQSKYEGVGSPSGQYHDKAPDPFEDNDKDEDNDDEYDAITEPRTPSPLISDLCLPEPRWAIARRPRRGQLGAFRQRWRGSV